VTDSATPFRYGFILLPKFSTLTLSCLVEPLRIANYCAGQVLFEWQFLSADGGEVMASTELAFPTLAISEALAIPCSALIVCGGWNAERYDDPRVLRALRQAGREGLTLGAVETGSYVLARAGLLKDHRATIHWHCNNAFAERFPTIELLDQLYVIDRKRMTCAGGTACLDMMLEDIESRHGAQLAREVASQVLCVAPREAETAQRQQAQAGQPQIPPVLQAALDTMEQNVEEPVSIPDIARQGGVSQRKLERLFNKHLRCSAVAYYRIIRLQRARVLLTHTDMSVMDICIACGFSSSSYFSKSYTEQFGVRPRDHRNSWPDSDPSPRWPAARSAGTLLD
jgi:transcriptional regulator GlxA family with amidase domain